MVQKTIKKKIGKEVHTFIVQGETMYDVLMEAGKFSFGDIEKCGICGGENLLLGAHEAKGKFKYVDIKCQNYECRASLTFGRPQEDPSTFYLRKEDTGKKNEEGKAIKQYAWKPFKIDE